MKSKRWPIWVVVLAVLVGMLWGWYVYADPEDLNLDDTVRAAMPGQFARLTDGYTHYELGGPTGGRMVVLAAGFSVPYYIWDPTYAALTAAGFRVLRYDYYGRGYSDRPAIAFTDDMYVRQLDELLGATGAPAKLDLVGLSFGGSLITSFADKYPDRVQALIYVDPSIRKPYVLTLLESLPPIWNYLTAVLYEKHWADGQFGDFLYPEKFPDWANRYRDQMRYKGFRRARLAEFASNAAVDQSEQLQRVGEHPRPVLVIWGKQDYTVPFEDSEWFMKALPNGRLVAIEDSGHLPQWEQPQIMHRELIDFLKGDKGAAPASP
jgi:pimeloyl-ACP methyl ester carboxylesterase